MTPTPTQIRAGPNQQTQQSSEFPHSRQTVRISQRSKQRPMREPSGRKCNAMWTCSKSSRGSISSRQNTSSDSEADRAPLTALPRENHSLTRKTPPFMTPVLLLLQELLLLPPGGNMTKPSTLGISEQRLCNHQVRSGDLLLAHYERPYTTSTLDSGDTSL